MKYINSMRPKYALFALFIFLGASPAFAQLPQIIGSGLQSGSAARYSYVTQGDQSIEVDVWGTVRFPGRFEVPLDANLGDLIALSGGPLNTTRDSRLVSRITTVRISRGINSNRSVVFEQDFQNLLNLQGSFPNLENGDVIMIETIDTSKNQWVTQWLLPLSQLTATIVLIVLRANQVN